MAAKVPPFGSWEGGENYTAYFDNARKTKSTGPMINPNDPEENPDMFPQNRSPRGVESQGQQSKALQFGAWEDGDGYTAYFEDVRKTKNNRPSKIEKEPQLNRDMNRSGEPHEPQSEVQPQKTNIVTEGTSDVPEMSRGVTQRNDHGQEGRSKVPEFGAWDGKEGVQYTAYFENARKNRAEPVEPQLNRDVGDRAKPTKVRSEENMGQGGLGSNYDQRRYKDDGQLQNTSRGSTSTGSEKQGTQTPGGRSPLHSRAKPQSKPGGRGSQTPERGTTIPPFGVWHKDPTQAEGFTGPFIRSREDRMTPLNNTTLGRFNNQSTQNTNQNSKKKWCCCPWF